MKMSAVCLIALAIVCILIQPIVAQSQCRIIVNDGKAAGAYVEVLDGDKRVFWGPTNSKGICYPDLIEGKNYTVLVKWNGRDSTTNIIAKDPVNVWV